MIRSFYIIFLISLLLFSSSIDGQSLDSIEGNISAMPETEITLRLKARDYILQNLQNNDASSIDEVLRLYSEKYHDTIMVLLPSELVLYNYWKQDYGKMLKAIKSFGLSGYYSEYFSVGDNRHFYSMYFSDILDFFCTEQYRLYSNLDKEYLDDIDRDFLKLYLTYNLRNASCESKEVSSFNDLEASRNYLKKYPGSPYSNYLQEKLLPVYEASRLGFGLIIISGWGDHMGDYNDYFRYGGLFGFGADIVYGRLKTYYSFSVGLGKTKKGFEHEDLYWDEKQKIASSVGEISAGIAVIDKPKLRCVPYYGISWETIEQRGKSTDDDVPSMYLSSNHLVGLNVDWVFNPATNFIDNNRYHSMPLFNDGFLRVKVGYMFPHAGKEVVIEEKQLYGSSLYVQIGLGFNWYFKKKVKL